MCIKARHSSKKRGVRKWLLKHEMDTKFTPSIAQAMILRKSTDDELWKAETRFHPELPQQEAGHQRFCKAICSVCLLPILYDMHLGFQLVGCFSRSSANIFAFVKIAKKQRFQRRLKGFTKPSMEMCPAHHLRMSGQRSKQRMRRIRRSRRFGLLLGSS